MALFENFPWTNLHQLNLNWLIEEVKKCYSPDNPPDAMVISVNGESGVVTLYKDARVNLPDVTEEQWNIYRGTAEKITGIEFNKDKPSTRINGNQRFVIYDAGNPPPYPVIAVNGETGNVILYEEPYVVFPDVDGDNWGLERKLNTNTADETRVGIMFDDTGKAYITHDEDATQILTIEDIPSSSGVVSVNGQSGIVNLTGVNINQNTQQDSVTIDQAINNTNTALQSLSDSVNTSIEDIEHNIETIQTDISTANTNIENINTQISTIDTNLSDLQTTVNGMKVNNATRLGYVAKNTVASDCALSDSIDNYPWLMFLIGYFATGRGSYGYLVIPTQVFKALYATNDNVTLRILAYEQSFEFATVSYTNATAIRCNVDNMSSNYLAIYGLKA